MSIVKPATAVALSLMEIFRCLALECHVSTEGFWNSIKYRFQQYPGYGPIVSVHIFRKAQCVYTTVENSLSDFPK